MFGPVRVKAYGLIEFTKRQYVMTQSFVLVATVALLAFAAWWQPTGIWAANLLFANLFWVVLIVLILELGETAVMLGKFRAKEARASGKGLT